MEIIVFGSMDFGAEIYLSKFSIFIIKLWNLNFLLKCKMTTFWSYHG